MPRTPSTSRNTYGRDSMFSRPSYAPGDIPSTAKRQSVLPPRGGFKDTRPVNDKQYQNDCKGRIGNFLIENNAPGFNEKMLSEPNKSHFSKIFEFLYQKLDPSFNLTSSFKIEHVLPIFAALQYPVQLKTSDIQCLSAPFIWAPKVLPALDWLIELIM
uniref:Kinetochore protein NDC80 n=1 Tax=Acrobeloides nanus TaxID=290746 RepID=A0A914D8Y5_9BILA